MMTLTGRNARTLSGYVDNLLDYPRWVIERDVDFTHCRYRGTYTASADRCQTCRFGVACRWLNVTQPAPSLDNAFPELLNALTTAARYLRSSHSHGHEYGCDCETCSWLRQARQFLHSRRH